MISALTLLGRGSIPESGMSKPQDFKACSGCGMHHTEPTLICRDALPRGPRLLLDANLKHRPPVRKHRGPVLDVTRFVGLAAPVRAQVPESLFGVACVLAITTGAAWGLLW